MRWYPVRIPRLRLLYNIAMILTGHSSLTPCEPNPETISRKAKINKGGNPPTREAYVIRRSCIMNSNEKFSLERKKIVNARLSEEEYLRLRTHASRKRVSLSFLMRWGLEPIIGSNDDQHASTTVTTLETRLN